MKLIPVLIFDSGRVILHVKQFNFSSNDFDVMVFVPCFSFPLRQLGGNKTHGIKNVYYKLKNKTGKNCVKWIIRACIENSAPLMFIFIFTFFLTNCFILLLFH